MTNLLNPSLLPFSVYTLACPSGAAIAAESFIGGVLIA